MMIDFFDVMAEEQYAADERGKQPSRSLPASPAGVYRWQPIETLKLGGNAVLLFAEAWKDPDFNPQGVREGFRNESDDGPLYSAKWNDCHECWDTVVNYEATHWLPRPDGP